jgi:alpha-tubulin suppressor-like RCC1 family protein
MLTNFRINDPLLWVILIMADSSQLISHNVPSDSLTLSFTYLSEFGLFCTTEAVSLATGDEHTCVVMNDNSVYCWGNNKYGQLGTNQTAISFSPIAVAGLKEGILVITCILSQ